MYEEPDEIPSEDARDPGERAREESDKLRMHAELAAVFEGPRKFDAQMLPGLDADLARAVQRAVGKLGNAIVSGGPFLTGPLAAEAATVLSFAQAHDLSTNDYHVHRRPGEVMIIRWLAGDEVDTFYDRLQAHFDAGLAALREDERQANQWKQDPAAQAYLAALEAVDVKMGDRLHRDTVRRRGATVLSTTTADEINISYLCDHVMGVPAAEVVGERSAPPEDGATERDLAWYFKLFNLRGIDGQTERACFFTFLQKADDTFGDDW
jgi:hypothetical protein